MECYATHMGGSNFYLFAAFYFAQLQLLPFLQSLGMKNYPWSTKYNSWVPQIVLCVLQLSSKKYT